MNGSLSAPSVPLEPPPHVARRVRLELPNGAQVVCYKCFLPIGISGDGRRWLHAYSGNLMCRPDGPLYILASPYLYPLVEEFLGLHPDRADLLGR